jgi:hypothetical protein
MQRRWFIQNYTQRTPQNVSMYQKKCYDVSKNTHAHGRKAAQGNRHVMQHA